HLGGGGLVAVLVGRHLLRGVHDVLRLALRHGPDPVGDRVLGLRDGDDCEGEGTDGKQGGAECGSHPRISCEGRSGGRRILHRKGPRVQATLGGCACHSSARCSAALPCPRSPSPMPSWSRTTPTPGRTTMTSCTSASRSGTSTGIPRRSTAG